MIFWPKLDFRSPVSWRTAARQIEATIGVLAAFNIGLFVAIIPLAVYMNTRTLGERLEASWTILLAVGEAVFLWRLKVNLEEADYPFAPWFALQQWRWPRIWRPVFAAWWLAHFALAIAGAIVLQQILIKAGGSGHDLPLRVIAAIVVSFTCAYSANLFLLLVVTCFTKRESVVDAVWRKRFWMDGGVALAASFFPLLTHPGDIERANPVRRRAPATLHAVAKETSQRATAAGRFAIEMAMSNFSPVAGIESDSAISGER